MICEDLGINYDKVRFAMVDGYDRASQIPSAGFAAGPCLLKDTMQISSIYNNGFLLGHSAMMINEGLPNYLVSKLRSRYDLKDKLDKCDIVIIGTPHDQYKNLKVKDSCDVIDLWNVVL